MLVDTFAFLLPTFAAHGSRGVLQRLPLSVRATADANVHHWLVTATGGVFVCDEGGCVGDGEAGEGAHHQNVPFLHQQGGDCVWCQSANFILQRHLAKKSVTLTEKLKRVQPENLSFQFVGTDKTQN